MNSEQFNRLLRLLVVCGLGFLAGWRIGLSNARQSENELTAQTAKIESLTRELKLADDEIEVKQRGIEKCFLGDGTKTVIVSTFTPGAQGMMAGFMTNALVARGSSYGLSLVGPAIVIPRRIVPTTTDGDLAFQYAYLGADGKVEGWFQPQKAK